MTVKKKLPTRLFNIVQTASNVSKKLCIIQSGKVMQHDMVRTGSQ